MCVSKVNDLGAERKRAFNKISDLHGGTLPLLTVGKFRKNKEVQLKFSK